MPRGQTPPDDVEYPTEAMVEIATRHTTNSLADIANEGIKGLAGWKLGLQPRDILYQTILSALMDAEAQRRGD